MALYVSAATHLNKRVEKIMKDLNIQINPGLMPRDMSPKKFVEILNEIIRQFSEVSEVQKEKIKEYRPHIEFRGPAEVLEISKYILVNREKPLEHLLEIFAEADNKYKYMKM